MIPTLAAYNSNIRNIFSQYFESYENYSSTKKIKPKLKITFSFYKPLLSEKFDNSSLIKDFSSYLSNIGTETVFTEQSSKKLRILNKISYFLDKIMQEEKIDINTNKEKILSNISEILDEIPVEKMEISDEELHKRIRKIIAVESIAGMLNELTPEQRRVFEEEIKRRPLFKYF